MAKKIVRTYYSTYVDRELDDADFNDEHEMMEYVRLNIDDVEPDELYHNLCFEPMEQEVLTPNK